MTGMFVDKEKTNRIAPNINCVKTKQVSNTINNKNRINKLARNTITIITIFYIYNTIGNSCHPDIFFGV